MISETNSNTAKIPLTHPQGKKAISMEAGKYAIISDCIIRLIKPQPLSHKDLLEQTIKSIEQEYKDFKGSPGWHAEWVKLDLEAKGIIRRVSSGGKIIYEYVKSL